MKIANIEDSSRNEIQQLKEIYYSLQRAYLLDNKDNMINAFIKANNLNIPHISNGNVVNTYLKLIEKRE